MLDALHVQSLLDPSVNTPYKSLLHCRRNSFIGLVYHLGDLCESDCCCCYVS